MTHMLHSFGLVLMFYQKYLRFHEKCPPTTNSTISLVLHLSSSKRAHEGTDDFKYRQFRTPRCRITIFFTTIFADHCKKYYCCEQNNVKII